MTEVARVSGARKAFHRFVLEEHPAPESCSCDPAYGVWCGFHGDFDCPAKEIQWHGTIILPLGPRRLSAREASTAIRQTMELFKPRPTAERDLVNLGLYSVAMNLGLETVADDLRELLREER